MAKIRRAITIRSLPKMSKASSSSSAPSNEPSEEYGVRKIISKEDCNAAAHCLADAFWNDDVAQYFIQTADTETWTEDRKKQLHWEIMRCLVRAHILKGLALTVGPNFDCVALWMPPGKNIDDRFTQFRSGMWHLKNKLSNEGKCRFEDEFLPLLHRTKTEVLGDLDDDSWYLVYIGTKPGSQGRGYARMLIEHVTKQADAGGRACYLESSNDINPAIYGKFGFETVKKIQLTRGPKPVNMDVMVRHPTSTASPPGIGQIDHHGQTAETA